MPADVRIPSTPLVTCDPYFSLWSPSDKLNESAVVHWTGVEKPLDGRIVVDGTPYRFLGIRDCGATAAQTGMDLAATVSTYRFEAGGVSLRVAFRTPLLLDDLDLVSRPCSYMDFEVSSRDGMPHSVQVVLEADEALCYDGPIGKPVLGSAFHTPGYRTAWMGRTVQTPLGHSGDGVTIDWGYFHIACPADAAYTVDFLPQSAGERGRVRAQAEMPEVLGTRKAFFLLAYDDILSILYFETARKGYWARGGRTVYDAIGAAIREHEAITARCEAFDSQLEARAADIAGDDYALVCAAGYRQSIAAHKLIEDGDGLPVFLSKECFSNGCIGTVDVSYPSVPLYLLFNPELVRGMLRPVYRFARTPVWDRDFAPHDVGRYPYATGQVYALCAPEGAEVRTNGARLQPGEVYPPFYAYPEGISIYDDRYQMPVEECGNMLIMEAAILQCTGDAGFAAEHMDLLEKWVGYLLKYGADPGDQLCTDDFGGHLAHNVNLAGKAVMGIAGFARILDALGRSAEAGDYRSRARRMAADVESRAVTGDHTALAFGDGDGWSLKYNLVWDRVWDTGLFSEGLIQNEIRWYRRMSNAYGVPLDVRKDYTKTDWILWIAAMAETAEDRTALIGPVAAFLRDTPDRVPFTDFYYSSTARHRSMQNRSVQGGLFMPMLRDSLKTKGSEKTWQTD